MIPFHLLLQKQRTREQWFIIFHVALRNNVLYFHQEAILKKKSIQKYIKISKIYLSRKQSFVVFQVALKNNVLYFA